MKSFDIEDTITKLNQVSTKRAEVFIDHQISSLNDLLYYFVLVQILLLKKRYIKETT